MIQQTLTLQAYTIWHNASAYVWKRVRTHRVNIFVAIFFFIAACALTWPFLVHPLTTQVGANYGDIFGSISKFDAIKNEHHNPFVDGHLYSLAYPDNIQSNVGVDRVSFFSTLFLWVFTLAVNATFAHNMYVFLGYFVTAFIMFLFIRRYTASATLGIIAGSAFITFPLFISLARAAPVYMWSWLYILPVWAMIELTKTYSPKRLLIAGLSIIPGVFWTPYFMLHVFLIALACFIVYLSLYYKHHRTLPYKQCLVLIGVVAVTAGTYVAVGHSSSASVVPSRPISDAYEQSLNPFMLITPTENTAITYPVYDTLIKPLRPRGMTVTLYAGLTICVLAILGTIALFRAKNLPKDMRLLGLFGLAVAVVSLSFSLAPTITLLGIKIPTPNYFVVHAVPALRAGQRLVVPIMLGLIVLAMIGIYTTTRKLRRRIRPSLAIACFTILIGIEYVTVFDQMTAPVYTSAAVSQLASAPKGIVAEYFNNSLIGYPGQLACKNYLIHHHQTVNSCSLDIYTDPGKWPVINGIDKLPLDDQINYLRHLGVRYIIVDSSSITTETIVQSQAHHLFATDTKFRIYTLD